MQPWPIAMGDVWVVKGGLITSVRFPVEKCQNVNGSQGL